VHQGNTSFYPIKLDKVLKDLDAYLDILLSLTSAGGKYLTASGYRKYLSGLGNNTNS